MAKCPVCNKEFKHQGALNLHLERSKCRTPHRETITDCQHQKTRLLTEKEKNMQWPEEGEHYKKTIRALGFNRVCLDCDEVIK